MTLTEEDYKILTDLYYLATKVSGCPDKNCLVCKEQIRILVASNEIIKRWKTKKSNVRNFTIKKESQ